MTAAPASRQRRASSPISSARSGRFGFCARVVSAPTMAAVRMTGARGPAGVILQQPLHAGRPDVIVAGAVQPLVLHDEALRREVRAVPDVALARGKVEFGAGLGRHAEADVARAAIAHLRVRHAMLDDLERGPALHALVVDRRASGDERGKEGRKAGKPCSHA